MTIPDAVRLRKRKDVSPRSSNGDAFHSSYGAENFRTSLRSNRVRNQPRAYSQLDDLGGMSNGERIVNLMKQLQDYKDTRELQLPDFEGTATTKSKRKALKPLKVDTRNSKLPASKQQKSKTPTPLNDSSKMRNSQSMKTLSNSASNKLLPKLPRDSRSSAVSPRYIEKDPYNVQNGLTTPQNDSEDGHLRSQSVQNTARDINRDVVNIYKSDNFQGQRNTKSIFSSTYTKNEDKMKILVNDDGQGKGEALLKSGLDYLPSIKEISTFDGAKRKNTAGFGEQASLDPEIFTMASSSLGYDVNGLPVQLSGTNGSNSHERKMSSTDYFRSGDTLMQNGTNGSNGHEKKMSSTDYFRSGDPLMQSNYAKFKLRQTTNWFPEMNKDDLLSEENFVKRQDREMSRRCAESFSKIAPMYDSSSNGNRSPFMSGHLSKSPQKVTSVDESAMADPANLGNNRVRDRWKQYYESFILVSKMLKGK
eukprot:CAMPEP_0115006162 /NCGR_PEP_ID=MMETSP0216-20121206/20321_1 /TAXON_ID=223996 /ORGANISM="Protocruzia adherens, Strain Boccale" /LENGTH=476 /DNA_ID=CAMNT_0002372663 /DNA_START=109 /DNA_END=1539 /DNA_ORIENTATION=+